MEYSRVISQEQLCVFVCVFRNLYGVFALVSSFGVCFLVFIQVSLVHLKLVPS